MEEINMILDMAREQMDKSISHLEKNLLKIKALSVLGFRFQ